MSKPRTSEGVWNVTDNTQYGYNYIYPVGEFYRGTVYTPQGMVAVISSYYYDHTSLDMLVDGTLYRKYIRKAYSKRHLGTLARKYAKEISERTTNE
jgi:hypothetical protein